MSRLRDHTLRVFRWDLRYQLRDLRTLAFMVLSPLLLVPGTIWLSQTAADRQQAEFAVAAPPAFAAWTRPEDGVTVVGGTLEAPVVPPGVEAPVRAEVVLPEGEAPYRLRYRGASLEGQAARERIEAVIRRHDDAERAARFAALGLPAPDRVLAAAPRDVASAEARTGDLLGRALPIVLLLLVLSGGLYTALDLITGERERGTLETLLSAPVERRAVLYAKGLSVLITAAITTVMALASMLLSARLFDLGVGGDFALAPGRVALAGGLMLPLVVTLSAALMMLAARAPDYKAGQFLSAPAMLIGLLPAGVAALPDVELTAFLALVPITGVALAVRAVLSGVSTAPLIALAFGAAVLHAVLALRLAGNALTGERFLLGPPDRRGRHARGDYLLEAIGLFVFAVLCLWFFGQTAQALDLVGGMVFTQVATLALPAVAAVALLGRPLAPTLSLRAPRAVDLALALAGGVLATAIGQLVFLLQAPLIPIPESFLVEFGDAFAEVGLATAILTFAVLPGLCEELLFRGAILGLVRKRLGTLGACLLVGLLFGVIHLVVPRILPTAALGVLLTWAAIRSGSLWVPVVMHAVHNGLIFSLAFAGVGEDGEPLLPWWGLMPVAALAIGAVSLMRGRLRPPAGRAA
ncbi:MAG: CPBP family glutamic-type intramembrane protease [bacterium]